MTEEDTAVFSTSGFQVEVKQVVGCVVRPAVSQKQDIFPLAKTSMFWKVSELSIFFFSKIAFFFCESSFCMQIWDFLEKATKSSKLPWDRAFRA